MKGDLIPFFLFVCLSIFCFFRYRLITREVINIVGINKKYYPKHYIATKGWMKKYLKIYQTMIPRYLYFRAYFTVLQALLFFSDAVVYYLCDTSSFGVLLMIQFTIMGIEIINILIFYFRYRRKK